MPRVSSPSPAMVEIGLPGAAAELLRGRIIFFPDLEDEPVVFIVEVCGMLLCLSFGFAERFPSLLPFDFGRLKEDMWIHGLLDLVLLMSELCAGASWLRWTSSIVEESGDDAGSRGPTTDALLPRISCSYPTFGVRPSIWIGKIGGSMLECAIRRTVGRSLQLVLRKKINSRDLVVISGLLRVFSVRMGCTVLTFLL
ncbi:hypothetical protein SETIT_7G192200v2 [Setaria italica]|uniref:Uncharacterized protein n=1 Tax=Setaria italica TaxID=4555 RepID=A0A368RXP2_SETIT|nr:hypothetical protein SETIT_7G192200v2 [Setaria italica]